MTHPTLTRRMALGLMGAGLAFPRAALAFGVRTVTGQAFGTGWGLTGASGSDLAALVPAIEATFAGIDLTMSPWRRDSTVSRFNAGQGDIAADPALVSVTRAALDLAAASEGAFDPTVGPLVAHWGFGLIEGGEPDWRGLSAGSGTLSKTHADLTLDLCGIAKGHALDRAAAIAREAGVQDVLLDLGGELVALGQHPAGRDWRVAVASPLPGGAPPAALRLPAGAACATSGLGQQGYTVGGRTYGHIIDPATGNPARGRLRSVTVVAEDAMTADGWATALFAAGEEAGQDLAAARGLGALFLVEMDGALHQRRTGRIAELLL